MKNEVLPDAANDGIYYKFVLGQPGIVILLLLSVFVILGYQVRNFRLDASADSLILENDKDLRYYREISERYSSSGSSLLVTFSPEGELFSGESLAALKNLRDDLKKIDEVSSVVTILDVPLLSTPPVPLTEIRENIKTLESENVDMVLAKKELTESPIYSERLIAGDTRSSILQVNLAADSGFEKLYRRRNELINRKIDKVITPAEVEELLAISVKYNLSKELVNENRHQVINKIRRVMERHKEGATLFLGGVPMISDDMITFIKNDIRVFGLGMVLFLIVTLAVIFRKPRWVVITILCCACSTVAMAGLVSIMGWQVTVISSNFISIQLVMTMSITIHLIVRHNELVAQEPGRGHREIVYDTVSSMIKPCLFTTLTTIAGFGSLLFCDILPVINFGWMMVIGLLVSLFVTFSLFPASLMLLEKYEVSERKGPGYALTSFFANITKEHTLYIYIATALVIAGTLFGISRIAVENSFIDYFRSSTEIYQGMKMIDDRFGGTTPLDIVIDFEADSGEKEVSLPAQDDSGVFDEFEEFDNSENEETYWFTPSRLELVRKAHLYLENQPEIGKVLSLHTMMEVIKKINGGENLDHLMLTLLLNELPGEIKDKVVYPYISIEKNQARLTMRIKDSQKFLKRDALLKRVKADLVEILSVKPEQIHLAGVMVLYNNMLQSLFHSQIETIGFTIFALMVMFLLLFRSVKISLIAIFPNLISSMSVLGVMGVLNIPLDMMTITIVAISIGIAVDDTIHYIHRFRHEFSKDRDYMNTVFRCHRSIGNAMYYTSVTIVMGFGILVFSNFIPSLLFGLLTGLSMVMALVSSLTLLPALIVFLKPFGPAAPGR